MRRIFFIITFLVVVFQAFADDNVFSPPSVPTLVSDNANVFTVSERAALTSKINAFSRETSTQILIYTTTDLKGYDIADFAQRLGEGWGVGQDGFDNGIVIVFKPKTVTERGRVTIQVGYGIEPLIPDAVCKRIIEHEMIPSFVKGLEYEGIDKAVDVCISLTKGEFKAKDYAKTDESPLGGIIFLIVFVITVISILRGGGGNHYTTGGKTSNALLWWLLLNSGHNRSSSSGFGGFGGGSGGFGGFGGGHFGGGGASGSW